MQDWKKENNKVYYWISSPVLDQWYLDLRRENKNEIKWCVESSLARYVTGIQFVLNIAPMFKMNNQQITKAFLSLYFLTNPYLILCFFFLSRFSLFSQQWRFSIFYLFFIMFFMKMLTNVSGVLVKGHNNIVKLSWNLYISSF
jgi:hypothetical protein